MDPNQVVQDLNTVAGVVNHYIPWGAALIVGVIAHLFRLNLKADQKQKATDWLAQVMENGVHYALALSVQDALDGKSPVEHVIEYVEKNAGATLDKHNVSKGEVTRMALAAMHKTAPDLLMIKPKDPLPPVKPTLSLEERVTALEEQLAPKQSEETVNEKV